MSSQKTIINLLQKVATGEISHDNLGDCPSEFDREQRDSECYACVILERSDHYLFENGLLEAGE